LPKFVKTARAYPAPVLGGCRPELRELGWGLGEAHRGLTSFPSPGPIRPRRQRSSPLAFRCWLALPYLNCGDVSSLSNLEAPHPIFPRRFANYKAPVPSAVALQILPVCWAYLSYNLRAEKARPQNRGKSHRCGPLVDAII